MNIVYSAEEKWSYTIFKQAFCGNKERQLYKSPFVNSNLHDTPYIFCFEMIHFFYNNILSTPLTFAQDIVIIINTVTDQKSHPHLVW